MISRKNRKLLPVLFAVIAFAITTAQSADEASTSTVPIAIDKAKLAGKGLETIPPFPPEVILSGGDPAPKLSALFRGEIVYGVFESKAVKFDVAEPWEYDEFVLVLAGELHLTDNVTGKTQIFKEGDQIIVPKGFMGIWEQIGDPYREIFIIERKAYEAVWGE